MGWTCRRLGILAAFLCFGVGCNVLVAWSGMAISPPVLGRTVVVGNMVGRRGVAAPLERGWPGSGAFAVSRTVNTSFGRCMSESFVWEQLQREDPDGSSFNAVTCGMTWEAGWPMRSLCCAEMASEAVALRGGFRAGTLTNGLPGGKPRPLPCWPMWPGFAANSALYAGVAWGARLGGRWWRRRLPPGQCRGCGYDLAGLSDGAVCPECGRASAARLPASFGARGATLGP